MHIHSGGYENGKKYFPRLIADGITGTTVDVTKGEVVLKGQVDDAQKKAKAEELAKQTDGVKGVKNELIVKKLKSA